MGMKFFLDKYSCWISATCEEAVYGGVFGTVGKAQEADREG